MRTGRIYKRSQKLVLPKYKQPPKIIPPELHEVREALSTDPKERTEAQNQKIFIHFLLNEKICELMNDKKELPELAKVAKYQVLRKNDVLFYEGDDSGDWFCILNGTLDVIVRLFLIAEDCIIEDEESSKDNLEYAPLIHQMDLDIEHNKLRKVKTLKTNDVFAYHSYILEHKRASTILCSSDYCELIVFPRTSFYDYCISKARANYNDYTDLIHNSFPALRNDQIEHIALYSYITKVPKNTKISKENTFGRNIYILKEGEMARNRLVDFTKLSFRTIPGAYSSLDLKFPEGIQAVHTDDLKQGNIFFDPILAIQESDENLSLSVEDFSMYNSTESFSMMETNSTSSSKPFKNNIIILKTQTDVELLTLDVDYFAIIVGAFEFERVKQNIKSNMDDQDIIMIWYNQEKERLWKKFKTKTESEVKTQLKGKQHAYDGTSIARDYLDDPRPTSMGAFRKRKITPKCSTHLAQKYDFSEPMAY